MVKKTGKIVDLTQGGILKTLLRLAIPIMLSNLMMVCYNVADTYWVGKLPNDKEAIAITANIFPIIWFVGSFIGGFLVAGTALISHATGSNRADKQRYLQQTVGQIIIVLLGAGVCFIFISAFGCEWITEKLNTPTEIKVKAAEFLAIIMASMVFTFVFSIYQTISHARGNSFTPMLITVFSVIFNIIVDPIMIFGYCHFPALGVMGAAYTTFI
ncbi:MAG: MATE family efflux transporter, partial [Lentisphaeria bacterium]